MRQSVTNFFHGKKKSVAKLGAKDIIEPEASYNEMIDDDDEPNPVFTQAESHPDLNVHIVYSTSFKKNVV